MGKFDAFWRLVVFGFLVHLIPIFCAKTDELVVLNNGKSGVAFSPYVKNWEQNQDGSYSLPAFDSYSLDEVKIMLQNITTRFSSIATYGMGVEWYNVNNSWDDTDSNCHIAKAAAQINEASGRLTLKVMQGIQHKPEDRVLNREIENAFEAAEFANKIYPGTVWALALFNQKISPSSGPELLDTLKQYKNRTKALGLKIGPRIQNCEDILQRGPNQQFLRAFARESDFLMCNQHLNSRIARQGPSKSAEIVFINFQKYSIQFKAINPDLEIILGETGWPSKGTSFGEADQKTAASIENMKLYWMKIAEMSDKYQVRSYLFEAFDEPWRVDYRIHDPSHPNVRLESDHSFGWWRRVKSDDIYSNVEKILDPNANDEELSTLSITGSSAEIGKIIGIVIGMLLVIFLPVIVLLVCRLRNAKSLVGRLTEYEIREFENGMSHDALDTGTQELALFMPYNRDYEIPKSKLLIEKNRILGRGQYGVVYKGKILGMEEDVAYKTVQPNSSSNQLKNLLSELKIMIYIGQHNNVVGLLGAYTAELRDGIAFIATELCALGSLESYLRSSNSLADHQAEADNHQTTQGNIYTNMNKGQGTDIRLGQMIRWSHEIASGMEWLERKKVIHADLATRNVLLAADKTAKITDFGLSRRLYEYTNYVKESQEPLPWRWMAIESMKSMQFSSQSDVWSYGVTLWEIFEVGSVPYPGLSWQIEFVQQLEKGLRLTAPTHATPEIYSKLAECWKQEPSQRPRFEQLSAFFKHLELSCP